MITPLRQWEVIKVRINPEDRAEHPAVIVSPDELCADLEKTRLNVLYGSTRRPGQAVRGHEILLNGADRLERPTVVKCVYFFGVDRRKVTAVLGRVTAKRPGGRSAGLSWRVPVSVVRDTPRDRAACLGAILPCLEWCRTSSQRIAPKYWKEPVEVNPALLATIRRPIAELSPLRMAATHERVSPSPTSRLPRHGQVAPQDRGNFSARDSVAEEPGRWARRAGAPAVSATSGAEDFGQTVWSPGVARRFISLRSPGVPLAPTPYPTAWKYSAAPLGALFRTLPLPARCCEPGERFPSSETHCSKLTP